ncbi:hypothetical protein GTQ99_00235 [Kineococcus sp. T13]|uniref:hypothetical protein n=1 Tax=Kineococcus vitellinus TaxID=2696565 RepID=UPI0014134B5C|nr:hypothetical protein [Kineococcus vitellinus]NAZ73858.1 hypothetical protein [Kineococcus vitellinus]
MEGAAAELVALRAAMAVELSYFPEQIQTDSSPYDRLKELYDQGVKAALPRVTEESGEDPTGEDGYKLPAFGFPVNCKPIGQVRW